MRLYQSVTTLKPPACEAPPCASKPALTYWLIDTGPLRVSCGFCVGEWFLWVLWIAKWGLHGYLIFKSLPQILDQTETCGILRPGWHPEHCHVPLAIPKQMWHVTLSCLGTTVFRWVVCRIHIRDRGFTAEHYIIMRWKALYTSTVSGFKVCSDFVHILLLWTCYRHGTKKNRNLSDP